MFDVKTTGNLAFTGIRCDTAIVNGHGKTADRETARELAALGYEVTPDPNAKPAKDEGTKGDAKK